VEMAEPPDELKENINEPDTVQRNAVVGEHIVQANVVEPGVEQPN
ncbi:hypothetical protein A2U01_0111123, partial [Trifolium medium]|nr:hypothetical protein [Trifolium medium]